VPCDLLTMGDLARKQKEPHLRSRGGLLRGGDAPGGRDSAPSAASAMSSKLYAPRPCAGRSSYTWLGVLLPGSSPPQLPPPVSQGRHASVSPL